MAAHERSQGITERLLLLIQGLGGMVQQPALEPFRA